MVAQLGVVSDVGVHRPDERRHDAGEDADEHLQKQHEPEACGGDGDEEEQHAEDDEGCIDADEERFLAHGSCQRNCHGHARHVGDFSDAEEEPGVEDE